MITTTGMILESWKKIEYRITKDSELNGFHSKYHGNVGARINFLNSKGVITKEQAKIINDLREIRNAAVHGTETFSETDAQNYRAASKNVVYTMSHPSKSSILD